MNRSPRGVAVIINNKIFLESSGQHLSPREGTDVDRDALKKLFQKLQFKVEIYNNRTKAEIRNIAEKKASSDHSNYDAFIFCILTHGEEGLVYGTDGTISIKDITSKFKTNTSLAGKPKIFFFQACQGKKIARLQITVSHRTNVREISAFDRQKLGLVGHYNRACLIKYDIN